MRFIFGILVFLFVCGARAQSYSGLDTVGNDSKGEANYVKPIFSDSLGSSFCIVIKKEVKAHKHQFHSEQVMVLEGEGLMKLDGKSFGIKKGDLIRIPMNSVHSVKVTGDKPMKVLSFQTPYFDGKDRIFVEEK